MMEVHFYLIIMFMTYFTHGKTNPCSTQLRWAPGTPRKAYITFLNDVSCPSWTTRHPNTRKSKNTGTLMLPRGTPFAFACGACFQSSNLKVNLKLETTEVEAQFETLTSRSGPVHKPHSHTDCLVSYGLTKPITKSGKIVCHLNRGSRPPSETINFSVRDVTIDEPPEKEIHLTSGTAFLQCPDTALHDLRNIVYVWHDFLNEEQPEEVKIVIASLRKNITYTPLKPFQRLSCSTYDFLNPYKVWRITYAIYNHRKEEPKIKQGEWTLQGKLREEKKPKISSGFLKPIIGLVAIATVVIIIGVVLSMGLCRCSLGRSALPQQAHESLADNKSNLLANRKDSRPVS